MIFLPSNYPIFLKFRFIWKTSLLHEVLIFLQLAGGFFFWLSYNGKKYFLVVYVTNKPLLPALFPSYYAAPLLYWDGKSLNLFSSPFLTFKVLMASSLDYQVVNIVVSSQLWSLRNNMNSPRLLLVFSVPHHVYIPSDFVTCRFQDFRWFFQGPLLLIVLKTSLRVFLTSVYA